MTHPTYTEAEAIARETFLALMWALSYPGRIYTLPPSSEPFALIADALLDLETSYFSPDETISAVLARTGAYALPATQAAYQFYATLGVDDIAILKHASIGTMPYPDTAATLILPCKVGRGQRYSWTGPGIPGEQTILLDEIPSGLWSSRESTCRYPLGWDIFFVDDRQVIGLPRGVKVATV